MRIIHQLSPSVIPVPFVRPDMKTEELEDIQKEMLDYASENGLFEDTGTVSRDLFDTKIIGMLVPPPSDVREHEQKGQGQRITQELLQNEVEIVFVMYWKTQVYTKELLKDKLLFNAL